MKCAKHNSRLKIKIVKVLKIIAEPDLEFSYPYKKNIIIRAISVFD